VKVIQSPLIAAHQSSARTQKYSPVFVARHHRELLNACIRNGLRTMNPAAT
jgi:hypothetical protein